MTESLPKQATRGVVFTASAQVVKVALNLAATVTVARLVSPADYGVIAMVAPLTALSLMLQDLGFNQAVVQARDLTRAQSNAAFWVNLALSFGILLVMVLSAPLVAAFYGDPRAGYVAAASGAIVFLGGFALQHTALLNRQLEFGKLALLDVATAAASFVATLVAALLLRSYWALVVGNAVTALAGVVLVWCASSFRPSLRPSFAAARSLMSLGGSVTGFNLLNYLSRNLDNVLIARFRGPTELGLYDRSYKLMMFPITNVTAPLARVMLPVLSRLRDDPTRYRKAFSSAVWGVMLLTAPAAGVAAATSDRLVPFILGEGWSGAAPIFFWLSLAAIYQPIASATGWLFISSGRGRALLQWGAFSSATTVASFAAGIPWGATGVAAGYVICSTLRLPLLYRSCTRQTSVTAGDLFRLMLPPAVTTLVSFAFVRGVGDSLSTVALLGCALALAYPVAFLAAAVLADGRAFFRLARAQIGRAIGDLGVGAEKASATPVDLT